MPSEADRITAEDRYVIEDPGAPQRFLECLALALLRLDGARDLLELLFTYLPCSPHMLENSAFNIPYSLKMSCTKPFL